MESAQDYPFLPVREPTVRPDRPAARTQQKLTQASPSPPRGVSPQPVGQKSNHDIPLIK